MRREGRGRALASTEVEAGGRRRWMQRRGGKHTCEGDSKQGGQEGRRREADVAKTNMWRGGERVCVCDREI